jgi:hypothetical protein
MIVSLQANALGLITGSQAVSFFQFYPFCEVTMSKNVFRLCLLLMLSFGLSACEDTRSPAGILSTAANAVKSGDVEALSNTLAGTAKQRYGSQAGIEELQKKFSDLDLKIGKQEMTKEQKGEGEEPDHPGHTWTRTTRDYQVSILRVRDDDAVDQQVAVANVECVTMHYRPSVRNYYYTTCLITDFVF